MLKFISRTGMGNAIDTVMQNSADDLSVFYATPHLIYSDCFRGDPTTVDTDIQLNYVSLARTTEERVEDELSHFDYGMEIDIWEEAKIASSTLAWHTPCYYRDSDEHRINSLHCSSRHPSYTINGKVIFIVPTGKPERYFDRLKKGGKYSIDDALESA